ncbi:MAG: hypothetical protein QXI19_00460 [Candidatus Caldarchaeum sp.]
MVKPNGHELELVFEAMVENVGIRDVFGAVYGETDLIEPYSLSTLQREGRAGKCLLTRDGEKYLLKLLCSQQPWSQ